MTVMWKAIPTIVLAASILPQPAAAPPQTTEQAGRSALKVLYRGAGAGIRIGLESTVNEPRDAPRDPRDVMEASTDEAGTVRFEGLIPGRYRVLVLDERFLQGREVEIDLVAGSTVAIEEPAPARSVSIQGKVRGPDGKAAPPTKIELYRAGDAGGPIAHASSDPTTGMFLFPRLAPGTLHALVVPGPGCLKEAQREVRPGGPPLELIWNRGESIEVMAVDRSTGGPVPSAQLVLAPPGFPFDRSPSSAELACLLRGPRVDDSGKTRFSGLAQGEHHLAALAPGYSAAAMPVKIPADPETPVTIRLSREGCLDVRVVDARSGEPIEGARIAASEEVLEDRRLGELAPPVLSDAAGRARFCPPGQGNGTVAVDHPDFAPSAVRAGPRAAAGELVVALGEGGTVEGVVRDRDGRPEPGVTVSALRSRRRFEDRTDHLGRYRLERVSVGSVTIARDSSPGGDARSRTVQVQEGRRIVLDFGPGSGLIYKILDRGNPVPDARVLVRSQGDEGGEVAEGRTDAQGLLSSTSAQGVPAVLALDWEGAWIFLTPPAPRAESGRREAGSRVSVGTGNSRPQTELHLPSRAFSGRLLDPKGAPFKDTIVVATGAGGEIEDPPVGAGGPPLWIASSGSASRTGNDGRFDLRIPPGVKSLLVILPGGRARTAPLPAGEGGDIVLESTAHFRVRVADADAPASLALVLEGQSTFARTASGGAAGAAVESDAEPGRYTLAVWSEGRAPRIEPGLLAEGGALIERDLVLGEGGSLRILFRSEAEGQALLLRPGFLVSGGLDWGLLFRGVLRVETSQLDVNPGAESSSSVVSPLPPDTFRVACPERSREVRVSEGKETVVDCR